MIFLNILQDKQHKRVVKDGRLLLTFLLVKCTGKNFSQFSHLRKSISPSLLKNHFIGYSILD